MSRFRHISGLPVARMTFAFVAALLGGLFSLASTAQAGCGDYVFIRDANGRLIRASSLMKGHETDGNCTGPHCPGNNPLATPSAAGPEDREESLPLRLPCSGPNCSGDSRLPAVPVPSPAPLRSSQESTALFLKLNDGVAEANTRLAQIPAASGHELHYPRSIFHPPR
jgi:hypothetical protein